MLNTRVKNLYLIGWSTRWVYIIGFIASCLAVNAQAIDPSDATPWIIKGRELMAQSDYEGAAISFQRSIETEGRSREAYEGLAKAYEAQGKMEQALKNFKLAENFLPGNHSAQTNGTFENEEILGVDRVMPNNVGIFPETPQFAFLLDIEYIKVSMARFNELLAQAVSSPNPGGEGVTVQNYFGNALLATGEASWKFNSVIGIGPSIGYLVCAPATWKQDNPYAPDYRYTRDEVGNASLIPMLLNISYGLASPQFSFTARAGLGYGLSYESFSWNETNVTPYSSTSGHKNSEMSGGTFVMDGRVRVDMEFKNTFIGLTAGYLYADVPAVTVRTTSTGPLGKYGGGQSGKVITEDDFNGRGGRQPMHFDFSGVHAGLEAGIKF